MGSPTKGRGDPNKTTKQQSSIKRQMKTKVVRKPDARSRQPTTKNKQSKTKTLNTKQEEGRSAPSTDEGEWRKRRKVVNR